MVFCEAVHNVEMQEKVTEMRVKASQVDGEPCLKSRDALIPIPGSSSDTLHTDTTSVA